MSTTIKDHTRVDKSAALIGRKVGKYEILEIVGKGGMGCVYAALNTSINKRVAMKCIDHDMAANPEANARFQREALAASSIESPHIVQIFDAGETDDGVPFIVMELLRGEDLGRFINAVGRVELGDALGITAQILKGLHHAHGAGIVHRDLKPDNVFLVRRDDDPVVVKLLDFGVSKIARHSGDVPLQTLTRQGTVVGTPFYMSPEQAQAFPDVDGRTDIYSVGAILYECLSGRPPHVGRAYEQVIVNICMKDADDVRTHNPEVPEAIADVIKRALSRERDERFNSAKEMLRALKDAAPLSLDIATSSPQLASISLEGSGSVRASTPRIVSTPRDGKPANELADTVRFGGDGDDGDTSLAESGISARTVAAETVRSQEEAAASGTRRRWPIALVPGFAVMLALMFWLRRGDDAESVVPAQAGVETQGDSNADSPEPTATLAENDPVERGDEPDPVASASASTEPASPPPVAAKPPGPPGAHPTLPGRRPPAQAPPAATTKPVEASKPKTGDPKPAKPPELELQTE